MKGSLATVAKSQESGITIMLGLKDYRVKERGIKGVR